MHEQNSLRLRVESLTQESETSPAEDLAAIADGAIGLDDLPGAQQDSINMRFGPLVLSDIICYDESEQPLLFTQSRTSAARPHWRIWTAIAAVLAIVSGAMLLMTVRQTHQSRGLPLATEQHGQNPEISPDPQIPTPHLDPARRALTVAPDTESDLLQVPIAELPDSPIPGTCVVRSSEGYQTPGAVPGTYTVFGIIELLDRDAGVAHIVISGRVSAWVNAGDGPVRSGDPLTFSSRDGMLRRAGKDDPAVAIAIGEIEDGAGLIEVDVE